jgi:5-deoxy-glucuronate isomerase
MSTHFYSISKASGYQALEQHSCELLGFAKLSLEAGQSYTGSSGSREIMLVALAGRAKITVHELEFSIGGRTNVFAGLPHSLYIPCGSHFTVEALSKFEAAMPSAPSDLDTSPYEIKPEQVNTGSWGALNFKRSFREILVQPNGFAAARLIVGETITPSGNWSTYPAHKHETKAGNEVFHEEMYYFRISAPEGWGFARHYSLENGYDNTHIVKDDSLLSIPHGYHTYAAAPGYNSYYLWFLAGDARAQGVQLDPAHAWIQKSVGTLV